METLRIIKELPTHPVPVREASRIVLLDENGDVAVLYVSMHDFYTIPGGGMHTDESREDAAKREAREETGCEISITSEVGKVIEYHPLWNLVQVSYCYLGKALLKGEPCFTEEEKGKGFQLRWLPLREAISRLERNPEGSEISFITERDLCFLQEAERILLANL